MPVKAEKEQIEPIRHLYESYNELKNQIQMLEHEGAARMQSQSSSRPPPRSLSPPQGMMEGPDSSGDDSSPTTSPSMAMARLMRKPARSRLRWQIPPRRVRQPEHLTGPGCSQGGKAKAASNVKVRRTFQGAQKRQVSRMFCGVASKAYETRS
jgi:hypothetical protein